MKARLLLAVAALALQAYAPPLPPPARIVAPAKARADLQSLIRAEDYPEPSRRLGEEGRVGFALYVGADGRVSACAVTRSSGSSALDAATCRLMRSRARFTPAVTSQGQPASSRVEQEVDWTLPEGGPAEAAPKFENWGHGMMVHSVAPDPVTVGPSSPLFREPIMAVPQTGPGEADLSVWDSPSNQITRLGRYESIPACRKVMAQLRLLADQRAYCTLAPGNHDGLDRDWRPPGER